jgi:WD40 repeat protein
MLSNINISFTNSSIYSDVCENSIELEEQYKKKFKNNNDKDKDNKSENIKLNNISENKENNLFNNFNNNKDKDKEEIINKLKKENVINEYILNKNINYENINNINLSNINIIINNNNKKEIKENNISNNNNFSKFELNDKSNKSIEFNENISDEIDKNIHINKYENEKEKENNIVGEIDIKNKNIQKINISESFSKNFNNNKFQENKILKKRQSNFSSFSSNLDINFSNDFENNITIINKNNKKEIDNKTIVEKQNISNKSSSESSSNYIEFANNFIKFEDISYNQIDLNYLQNLRCIDIKYKKKEKKYLKTLLELQNFYIDNSPVRVIKLSEDGQYLSAGLKSGKIKLFEIIGYDFNKFEKSYNKKNIIEYLYFIKEKPYRVLEGHKEDVIDLSWSPFYHYLLLSSSIDGNVILWNINLLPENSKIECFNHEKIVTCVSFSPTDENIFITGCLDKIVRIWNLENILNENKSKNNIYSNKFEKYKMKYFNIEEKITAIQFYPYGNKIAIGTHNGKITIFETRENLEKTDNNEDKYFYYKGSFTCRNRIGKNSFGKKITSIQFINKNEAVISSCDSRIRLISMNDGKKLCKYKGHINEDSMIKSSIDHNFDIIISGSEDGFCYVWDIYDSDEDNKNSNYEYFKPYKHDKVQCSLIVPEKIYCNFMKKIIKITNKLMITSIIINATNNGRLEVLLNIDDEN